MTQKQFNIFAILDAICNTKEDLTNHPLFVKTYNIFMINKWLSMHSHTLVAAYFADQINGLTKEQHFFFVQNLVEKKRIFIKYKKGKKKDKECEAIMNYFEVGIDKAHEFLQILDNKQIKLIKNAFGGKK